MLPFNDRHARSRSVEPELRPSLVGGVPQMPYGTSAHSEATAREVDCAVRRIVEPAFLTAVALLERNRAVLERGARLLLAKKTVAKSDLRDLTPAHVPAGANAAQATESRPAT